MFMEIFLFQNQFKQKGFILKIYFLLFLRVADHFSSLHHFKKLTIDTGVKLDHSSSEVLNRCMLINFKNCNGETDVKVLNACNISDG